MTKANEAVYANLRRRIMAGNYEPGAQLKEETLAAEMGVSRTPIRVAFQRLIEEGLLIARANRGVFIAGWTRHDIEEVMALRFLLEPHIARIAAERATDEQIVELRQVNQRMEQSRRSRAADRLMQIQVANNRFHQLLLEATSSPRLKRMAQNLIDMPMIIGSFYFYSEDELRQSVHHHDEIIRAVGHHDGAIAELAMLLHLRVAHAIYRSKRAHQA
jgi:DNA-binding GntR family transcriptional regulator